MLGEGGTDRCLRKANFWKQEKSSAEVKPYPCCPCPQSTEFATQCWGKGRSRVLQGLAQAWWARPGLAELCLCVRDGGKHINVPIKALFFSTKKQQNSVLPLCCWEMWDCLFRPAQQSPLCSPLAGHHPEMFPSLSVRHFVPSRTHSCSFVSHSGGSQRNSPWRSVSEVT